jgi:PAS domain S-box-containing protein
MESLANEQLRSLVWDLLPIGIFHADAQGRVLYANKYLCELLGRSLPDLQNDGWKKSIHPNDSNHVSANWLAAAKLCLPFKMEYRYLLPADKIIWAYCRAAPIIDASGKLMGYIGTIIDITQQKTVVPDEDHTKSTKEYFELGLQSANTGLWSWDIVNNTVTLDKRVYELMGMPYNKTLESYEDFLKYVYPEDIKYVNDALNKALSPDSSQTIAADFRVVLLNKKIRHIRAFGRTYFDENNKPVFMMGLCRDITNHIERDQRLRQQHHQSANVAYQNALSEMASSFAHELNQPLTAIATHAQLLVQQLHDKTYDQNALLKSIQHIAKQAERAGNITHRVKNFIKQKAIYCENSNIRQLIDESIELLDYENIGKLPELSHESAVDLPEIYLDRVQIQQVIINLIKNSIESLQITEIPNKQIKIRTALEDNKIIVSITDNGPGIPANLQSRIFEPYFTTKKTGLGIGLAICHSIIEAHGGQLALHSSNENEGTCFKFTLPLQ